MWGHLTYDKGATHCNVVGEMIEFSTNGSRSIG